MIKNKDIEKEISVLSSLDRGGNLTREEQIHLWMLKGIHQLVKDLPEEEEKQPDKVEDVSFKYFASPGAEEPLRPRNAGQVARFRDEFIAGMTNPTTNNTHTWGEVPTPTAPAPPLASRVQEMMSQEVFDDLLSNTQFVRRNPVVMDSWNEVQADGGIITLLEVQLDAN